jgi:hypothetical protein
LITRTDRAFAAHRCAREYDAHPPRDNPSAASKRLFRRAPPLRRGIAAGSPTLPHSASAPRRKRRYEAAATSQRPAFIVPGRLRLPGHRPARGRDYPGDYAGSAAHVQPGARPVTTNARHDESARKAGLDRRLSLSLPNTLYRSGRVIVTARLKRRQHLQRRSPTATTRPAFLAPRLPDYRQPHGVRDYAHLTEIRARGRCGSLAALGHRETGGVVIRNIMRKGARERETRPTLQ